MAKALKPNDHVVVTKKTDYFNKNEILKVISFDKKSNTIIAKGDIGYPTEIETKNFEVSIGTFHKGEVAVFSRMSGDFVKMSNVKDSKLFKRVRRNLKSNLNSEQTFTFSHMQPNQVALLVKILKEI